MAERKQVNRYYPPDFDPAKHKSINKYRNSHPLRERAKKLSQGILVIRFEMPYNIWCGGCGNHVGMGVRYNAEKKKVGNYYTTPIYRFRMKCHLCDNYIEMETDPKNFDYTIVSGARRKNQKWDMEENEQVLTEDREAVKKLARDAMYKLEHGVDDTKKLKKAAPSLSQIAEIQSAKKDDYSQNQILRKKFREKKKELLAEEASDKALLAKSSLEIDLLPENEQDKKIAALLKFSTTQSYEETRQQKRSEIQNRDIFALPSTSALFSSDTTPSSSSSSSSSASPSNKTPSKITHTMKHSEAHRTLMTQVLKRKGPGVFGAFSSTPSSSHSSFPSSNHTATRLLISGAKGLIVTKKRKQSCDSMEGQVKKRAKSLISEDQELNSKQTPESAPDKNSDCNKDEDDECKETSTSTVSCSSPTSAITASSTCIISTPASETEQSRTPEDVDCLHSNCKGESLSNEKCLHGLPADSEKAAIANTSDKCNNDKTSDVTNPTTDSVSSTSESESEQTAINKSFEQKTENASPSEVLREEISRSGAVEEAQEDKKELSSLSLVSCYSSSSESEGEP